MEEYIKTYDEIKLYVTETDLIYKGKGRTKRIPMASVAKMLYWEYTKINKFGLPPFVISIETDEGKIIHFEGKESTDVRRIYNDLYYTVLARNPEVISFAPYDISYEDAEIVNKVFEHYKDKCHVEHLPNADFPVVNTNASFAIYLDVDGKKHVLLVEDAKLILRSVQLASGEWVGTEEFYNQDGYEGLIKQIDAQLESKGNLKLTIKSNKLVGVILLVAAIMFLFLIIVNIHAEDFLAYLIMLAVFDVAFFWGAAYYFLWKLELVNDKIYYTNSFGRQKVFGVDDIDEVQKSEFMREYVFYGNRKRLFGIDYKKFLDINEFITIVNCSRKGKELEKIY